LRESTLHAALKIWYGLPGDYFEIPVDGFIIDIVRGNLLIEIQTGNFSAIRPKLEQLLEKHPIRIVHPIAAEKWIIRKEAGREIISSRRKSPRRGRVEDVFRELVRIPHLVQHPNFSLEILLIQEEETRLADGKGSWRRQGWSIVDRRLLRVEKSQILTSTTDYLRFIPLGLPNEFSTRQFASESHLPNYLAYKMVYCLRKMALIQRTGKRGRAYTYSLSDIDQK